MKEFDEEEERELAGMASGAARPLSDPLPDIPDEGDAPIRQACRELLGELDRLKVAYAHNLESHVEPPSVEIMAQARAALEPKTSPSDA